MAVGAGPDGPAAASLVRRTGWMAAIWLASVLALAAVSGVIRLWLR